MARSVDDFTPVYKVKAEDDFGVRERIQTIQAFLRQERVEDNFRDQATPVVVLGYQAAALAIGLGAGTA